MNNQVNRNLAVHDIRSGAHLCARDRRVLARILGRAEAKADAAGALRQDADDLKAIARAA